MRALALLLLLAAPAFADDGVTGTYDVKYEDAGNTCTNNPVTLTKGTMTVAIKKGALDVAFDKAFSLTGKATKDGSINVKTPKLIGTSMGGLSARYSAVGHAENGSLTLALTAMYIRQDTNKPFCAQTWNVTGSRK